MTLAFWDLFFSFCKLQLIIVNLLLILVWYCFDLVLLPFWVCNYWKYRALVVVDVCNYWKCVILCCSWWFEPLDLGNHEWGNLLPSFPWSTQLWPPETCCESHPIPSSSLLHGWLCTSHLPWLSAVPSTDGSRADPANVGCQKHDVCCWSQARTLPHRICHVQG